MVLGTIVLLGFFLLRKRRLRQYQEDRVNGSDAMASSPTYLGQRPAVEISAEQQWQLDGNAMSEIDGGGRSEMDGSGRSEMVDARRRI